MLGYLLLLLVPIAAVAYILWDHKRKAAARDAAAEGRLQELMAVATPAARAAEDGAAAPAAERTAAGASAAANLAGAAPEPPLDAALYALRGRVLNPAQTLLYLLLKRELPVYSVLPRVSLGAVLEVGPGFEGSAREGEARRLSSLAVDFVIADRSMRPVVVLQLVAGDDDGAAQAERNAARSRLAAAGVRYLELDPKRLPRRDIIRAVVLAEAPISA